MLRRARPLLADVELRGEDLVRPASDRGGLFRVQPFRDQVRIDLDPLLAEAHAALGMIYNKKDMLNEALSELQKALNLKPDLFTVYQEMYLVYKKKGMEEEAKSALNSYEKLKGSR